MCGHRCFEMQINDQRRKFVNEVCKQPHELTGVEQRVISAYHPQANGLIEVQNRTIKNSLLKVLEGNPEMLPQIIEGILFAHRVSRHSPTTCSPFMLMYNRESVLLIDVKSVLPTWTKMKTKNEKTEKKIEMKINHLISTFLMPSFHQRRKSEQQSRMIHPKILNIKASKKNKKKIMIVDICLKQKLRWVILCY